MEHVLVRAPPCFLPHQGVSAVQWKDRIDMFDNYLLALDSEDFNSASKKAILLNGLGSEAQRLFKYMPVATDNGAQIADENREARLGLNNGFAKETNVVLARYKFYTQPKRVGESIDEFVSRLRELSVKCHFGGMCEEIIRDQLMVQCKRRKIQERLWAVKNPSLKDAIKMAKVVEESELCMKEMGKHASG
ncbi:hypothetical protein NDU88_005257 [Pleurodeles waltl]|uniref:Uncharacterized protein n=1 Tax=Pleurodeles waltl TaxID=8319 RepID=A0AAV7W7B5_PLEWA|nr:hypothetical protein NDU88_005257 [Pleurodeles waltl]